MKSFDEWAKEDAHQHHVLAFTPTHIICDEKAALARYTATRLECYPVAKDLCLKILNASMDWWEEFLFKRFLQKEYIPGLPV